LLETLIFKSYKMKGRLIKRGIDEYILYVNDVLPYATTDNSPYKKLSLKNCQAIERGYDLDELASQVFPDIFYDHDDVSINGVPYRWGFIVGFQKALELMGNKKFDEHDMVNCYYQGQDGDWGSAGSYIESLQQTEWDVEVEMEGPLIYPANLPKEGEERPAYKPKLDSNDCLILKRI
jgi:hypothetical protein